MTPFRATPVGYEAFWEEAERRVLAGIAREVAAMLRDQAGLPERDEDDPAGALWATTQTTGTERVPDDPAARRLLPDASRDDDAVSTEFRHLTQTDIAAAKVRGLESFADLLDGGQDDYLDTDDDWEESGERAVVTVGHDAARTVAAALTDVRLVVAQRLGLETDDDVEVMHDEVLADVVVADPARGLDAEVRRYWGGVFVAAGFAQESLVTAMLDDLRGRRG
ncbi:DUF2017 family protein [Xylanimonas sp. McL0601]|uniref:DUF2017 family protein n=1 Tax=Xylanimonas sp. McL0601 TaxID=3414739 RepID=UPI003CF1564A